MDDGSADVDGREGSSDSAGARVRINGRRYELRHDGLIVKGPKATRGQYLSDPQLARIIEEGSYYGHLFLADSPANKRLAEAEYILMEHKANHGRATLVEGMSIIYNGQGGWRISELGEKAAVLVNGDVERRVSRARLEESASVDYVSPVHATDIKFEDRPEPDEIPEELLAGEIVINDKDMERHVNRLLEAKMDSLVDAVVERVVARLGNTLQGSGAETETDAL